MYDGFLIDSYDLANFCSPVPIRYVTKNSICVLFVFVSRIQLNECTKFNSTSNERVDCEPLAEHLVNNLTQT